MKKGRLGTMTHDYKRHGTTTLFAALHVLDGTVIGRNMARHRHQEFIRFLNALEREIPKDKAVHAIIDNYAAHKTPEVRRWLARHPRWIFHSRGCGIRTNHFRSAHPHGEPRGAQLLYDVFISHASEDKEALVRPLAVALRERHISVWYDEFSLVVGDSLRESIDRGLALSRFGIVVLSPSFFAKRWPARELNGLVAREVAEDRSLILPIWHNIGRDQVVQASPPLADLVALSSGDGIQQLVDALTHKIRNQESPLVVARDLLTGKGVQPPVVTDGWWLDVVEFKEAVLRYPDTSLGRRWIFPLPHEDESDETYRGENIAWSSLQRDWSEDGGERGICQMTHPELVHDFLRDWAGFVECARVNPGILALYAPQLTIPGFDDGFADVFDALLDPSRRDAYEMAGYSEPQVTAGDEPLCGELIAWRHPQFGNYADTAMAWTFVHAHTSSYFRGANSDLECIAWLLSNDSDWLPERLRQTILSGMRRQTTVGWPSDIMRTGETNVFAEAIWNTPRRKFKFNKTVSASVVDLFSRAVESLGLSSRPETITERFIESGFVEGFYQEQQRLRDARRRG